MYEEDNVKKMLLPAVRVKEDLWRAVIKQTQLHHVSICAVMRTAIREHIERIEGEQDDND